MTAALHHAPDLTERQTRVLMMVIQEHIRTGQPVPSAALAKRHGLSVSPATVRHEMAALEEKGLLTHPHTSAGRVPTVAGYRYFAEHLLRRGTLPAHERKVIRARFLSAGWDPERWMQIAADMIAQASGAAGLAAALPSSSATLRRVEMVDLGDGIVQIIVVLADGQVRQVRWCPRQEYDQQRLDRFAGLVNARLAGATAVDWTIDGPWDTFHDEAMLAVRELANSPLRDAPSLARLYHSGLARIVDEPQLALSGHLRHVVAVLEHGEGLDLVLARLRLQGAHVFIGGEPPLDEWPPITLILSRFGGRTRQDGVVGVVGPTRLPYERAVPAVEYVAELMTHLLAGQPVVPA